MEMTQSAVGMTVMVTSYQLWEASDDYVSDCGKHSKDDVNQTVGNPWRLRYVNFSDVGNQWRWRQYPFFNCGKPIKTTSTKCGKDSKNDVILTMGIQWRLRYVNFSDVRNQWRWLQHQVFKCGIPVKTTSFNCEKDSEDDVIPTVGMQWRWRHVNCGTINKDDITPSGDQANGAYKFPTAGSQ